MIARPGWVEHCRSLAEPFFNEGRPGPPGGCRKRQLVNWGSAIAGQLAKWFGRKAWRGLAMRREKIEWLALSGADRHRRLYDEVRL